MHAPVKNGHLRMVIEERMVRKHISNLAKQGYLQRERRTIGGVNVYYLDRSSGRSSAAA